MPRLRFLLFAPIVFALPAFHLAAQSATAPSATLKLNVRRVPLDIVVTDKNGDPVRGLQKSDFIIKEDKRTQKALSFEYLDATANAFTPPKLGVLPVNTFVDLPATPEQGPLNVLYYDMVNSSMVNQMEAHKQLLDFVDHAQPGTRFALFVNAHGVHLVQGFTSDHVKLHAAILSKGPGPHLPDVFIYGQNYGRSDAGAALSNLKFLADYLNGIPGRKNLLWLSSEFPIPVGPLTTGHNINGAIGGGFSHSTPEYLDLTYLLRESIKKTYSAMEASQVALYPVDLNGVTSALPDYDYEDQIASATGGHAYHGNNSLKQLLDRAVANGSSYYALTYSPTNTNYDGNERHIQVALANKADYTLTYRMVYYGLADGEATPATHKAEYLQARFVANKSADNLYANIEHGAPMLHDLLFSAHVAANGAPQMATADQMLQLEDSPAYFRTRKRDKPLKPLAPVKLQKYVIGYGIIDTQLKSSAQTKGVSATLEFAAAAYDADGLLLNSMLNEGQVAPPADAAAKSGALFHADQELDVPPGAAWLRLAVRDKLTNRTGTLEVPLPLKPESSMAALSKSE